MSSGENKLLLSTKYLLQAVGLESGSNILYPKKAVRRLFVNYIAPWHSQTESDEDVDSCRFGDTPPTSNFIDRVWGLFLLYIQTIKPFFIKERY